MPEGEGVSKNARKKKNKKAKQSEAEADGGLTSENLQKLEEMRKEQERAIA